MTYHDLLTGLQFLTEQGLGPLPIRGWQAPAPRLPLNGLEADYTVLDLLRAVNGNREIYASKPVETLSGIRLNLLAQARDHVLLIHALPERCPGCAQ